MVSCQLCCSPAFPRSEVPRHARPDHQLRTDSAAAVSCPPVPHTGLLFVLLEKAEALLPVLFLGLFASQCDGPFRAAVGGHGGHAQGARHSFSDEWRLFLCSPLWRWGAGGCGVDDSHPAAHLSLGKEEESGNVEPLCLA